MALNGFDEDQIKEAAWVVQNVAGASAYIYGIGYDKGKFQRELEQMVEHIRKQASDG